jgi:uncharacterized protein DUF4154
MFRRLNPGTAVVVIYCALAACACIPAARAEESVSVEYKIKAAYLLNFAKFVDWPTNRFPTPTTPIRVGVLGKDPFGSDLERTIGGRIIEGRKCEIVRTDDADAALSCHIVFISSSERKQAASLLEKLHRGNVLTVGESEQFIEQGGIIQFYLYDNTVRFEINKQQAEKAKLRISSKLLQVAKPPPGRE